MYRNRIRMGLSLLAVLAWLWPVSEAAACSCVPVEPPEEALKTSAAVFSGKVASVSESGQEKTVELEVIRIWKGIEGGTAAVKTAKQGPSCGFPFRKGETYLVYAGKDEAGMLTTSICSRTRQIREASEDLAALGEGKKTQPPAEEPTAGEHGDTRAIPEQGGGNAAAWLAGAGAALAVFAAALALRRRK